MQTEGTEIPHRMALTGQWISTHGTFFDGLVELYLL